MNLEQWQRSKKIKAEAEAAAKRTVERVLNTIKEPAMSEFKVGDKVVFKYESMPKDLMTIEYVSLDGSCVDVIESQYPLLAETLSFARKEEIAAGHRIDCETLDHEENHISPHCKSRDV